MNKKCLCMVVIGLLLIGCRVNAEANDKSNCIIVLDPGHGGIDVGAQAIHDGVTYTERELNLTIANYCKNELEKHSGITVYMTRYDNDTRLDLEQRVEIAAQFGADYLISIHNNSNVNSNVQGVEVIVPNKSYNINSIYERASDLGNRIVEKISELGLANRGIYYKMSTDGERYPDGNLADYYGIINRSKKKGFLGIIIEHAYLSNKSDAITHLTTEEALEALGLADATAIIEYLESLEESPEEQPEEQPEESIEKKDIGWIYKGDFWYYLNSDGQKVTGWKMVEGSWYYMNTSGQMVTGWQLIDGSWYYMNASGRMVTGWQYIGNSWYYMNASGRMVTGWQYISGAWYYLKDNGAMAKNEWIGPYYVNSSGVWVE